MSRKGVEYRAFKVSSVTGLSSVMTIGLQILTVPVCLGYWGAESYGTWLALLSAFSMLQITSAGFVNYVGNQLNLQYHQNEAALRKTLASALVGVVILGGLQFLVVIAVLLLGILPHIVGISKPGIEIPHIDLAMLALLVSWLLGGFYLGIVHRLAVPSGFMYQAAWWSLGTQLSLSMVIMLAAVAGADIIHASMAYALVNWCLVVTSAWYIRIKLPEYFPWWRGISVSQGMGDMLRSLPQIFSGLIQQGASNGLVLLVSAMAGAATVPIFTTVRTLSNLWTNVTNVLTTPLLPEVVRFYAKGEHDKLMAVQQAHSVLVGGSVNLGILLVFPLIGPFFAYWTRQTVPLDRGLLCALLASVSLFNLGSMMNTFLAGVNHHRTILLTTISRGGICFLLGAVLMEPLGIGGLGLAVWVGELVSLGWLLYYFHQLTRQEGGIAQVVSKLAPSLLGIGALTVFLGLEALAISPFWLYGLCIIGVCGSICWGWVSLPDEVRVRLCRLISRRKGECST